MQIKTYDNQFIEVDENIEGKNLLPVKGHGPTGLCALPALIDPHVHFRTPGSEHKEDWITGSQAALAGGITTVFDMPNNSPAITTYELLQEKKEIIDAQIKQASSQLKYYLYFGATKDNLNELEKVKDEIIGVKMFMGSSTGDLLVDKKKDQEKVFEKCAELSLVLAVHAESEAEIRNFSASPARNTKFKIRNLKVKDHSKLRPREAAIKAVEQVIALAEKYGTKLYILHVSTKEEVSLIRRAKSKGLKVYTEVTPHHLFLTEEDYAKLGTKAQVNPPLRTKPDQEALWQAIEEGIIDTIGTDHAPHTLEEKAKPYPQSPSGIPAIETCLPLLLNAYNQGKISLEKIVELTRNNIEKIFALKSSNERVIVDLNLEKEVRDEDLKTKCGWSPFANWILKGCPIAIVINNKIINLKSSI